MSISFTDGQGSPTHGSPSPNKPAKPDPIEQQRKRLQKQKEQIDQKLKKLTPITAPIKAAATTILSAPNDPNEDPMKIFGTIRPILTKMGIVNLLIPNKTNYIAGDVNPQKLNKFEVMFRRERQISREILDRLKRNEANFESLQWNAQGMIMTIWASFSEAQDVAPVTPAIGR